MLEESLKIIKDCNLDIELLHRQNELLCKENNIKIKELTENIEQSELFIEEELKKSGEDKLECKFGDYKGSTSWQKMPDKWEHDDVKLVDWLKKSVSKEISDLFLVTKISLKWNDFKQRLISDSPYAFEDGKINDKIIVDELTLTNDTGGALVKGVSIKRQDPKFKYSIKKIK